MLVSARRTYHVPSWLGMGGPPRSEQGQAYRATYGIDLQSGVAVRRVVNESGESWAVADLSDREMAALGHYDAGGTGEPPIRSERRWRRVDISFDP